MIKIQEFKFEIDSDDFFRVEPKMRKVEPPTEMEEMLEDILIQAKIGYSVQLNPDKINHFREYWNNQFPDEKRASFGYKEFVRKILEGGITFDNRHIRDLTPELQKRFGFEFKKNDIEE